MDPRTSELESLNAFMFQFCKTLDPLDQAQPVKLMPDRAYLRDLNRIAIHERLIAVPKSRQIAATWWGTGFYSWDCIRHPERFTIFKSIDKQHSGLANKLALLWRANFIIEQLPSCVRPGVKPWKRDNILEFKDNGSHIQAMSMEGEASRAFTATGVLDDELAVQQYGESGFAAILPTLGEIGRYIALFTYMGLNFAYRLAHDKMEI